jgi:hypothetical protein
LTGHAGKRSALREPFAGSGTLIRFFNADRLPLDLVTDQGTSRNTGMLALGQSVLENAALAIRLPGEY